VVTEYVLKGAPDTWPALPPIGRPIANTQVRVLDARLQPVPAGVPGELYVGGVSLARGYLHKPTATAERFIPDPFAERPDARLYRTGDIVKYLPDGNIDFLGRADHQVKVRGYRIEPGEIETVLGQHPLVREAVVLVRAEPPGEKRLVAYIAATGALTANELRGFAKERLPEYMVPTAYVMLDKLPLTPNGKIDRLSLPSPDQDRSGADTPFVAPATRVEKELAAIWSQVLNVGSLGIHDSFFDLGGHSLTATQLITRVRAAYGVELPLLRLFEMPTIAEFIVALLHAQLNQIGEEAVTSFLAKVEALSDDEATRQAAI
jgi:acyl carrier protein